MVTVIGNQIDGRADAQILRDLLRKVFEEFPGVGKSDRRSVVVAPKDKASALGVRKPAEGFQVVVLPIRLPFDRLIFGHGRRLQNYGISSSLRAGK